VDTEERGAYMRECPVPRPGGLVGTILGFRESDRKTVPVIRIEPMERRSGPKCDESGDR